MKRKLKDVTDKQVIQATPENDFDFRKMLDKEGLKWWTNSSFVILEQHEARISALESTLNALQIKPEYDHVLSFRDGKVIASEFVPYKPEPEKKPTEPEIKVGMFGAFADYEDDFKKGEWIFGELTSIRDSSFKYRLNDSANWKYFRPLENPFK